MTFEVLIRTDSFFCRS